MKADIDIMLVFSNDIPDNLTKISIIELVKDSITTNYNEVKLLSSVPYVRDVWIADNHTLHATKVWVLRFYISESTRY